MSAVPELSPLLQYELLPVFIAVGIIFLIIAWYGLVFWFTRKKPIKNLATLKAKPYVPPDAAAIKQKYLSMVDEVERLFSSRKIKARQAHQDLSLILRSFVSELDGTQAKTMTLRELKRSRSQKLAPTIAKYYKPAFAAVENGSVGYAAKLAREVIEQWS